MAGLFQRLLVPVDGSEPSVNAGVAATALASQTGGHILFCSVVDDAGVIAETSEMPWTDPTPVIETLTEDARGFLAEAERRAAEAHVPCTTELATGNPVEEIVRLADERGADLIVMGSHGRGGLERLILGSATEGVLRRCRVPLLVIRQDARLPAPP
jgi:nucleotide-binding universal stress UspA family protein